MAAIAVPCNTVFGVILALALVRSRFPGRGLVNAMVDLPLRALAGGGWPRAVPALWPRRLARRARRSRHQVLFAVPGMVLATMFVSLPFVVREVVPVLREIGTEQEQAAETLGARPCQMFWRITLPAIRWAVAYGVVLTTARALGEFGAVSVVSGRIRARRRRCTLVRRRTHSRTSTLRRLCCVRRACAPRASRRSSAATPAPAREEEKAEWASPSIDVTKRFGDFAALDDVSVDDPRRLADRAARPERQRQVDAAAHHRRARGARRRARS